MEIKDLFSIWNHHKCLRSSFESPYYWSTAIRNICNSFSAGTFFRRQNLTSLDVRFWRLKTVPALKGLIYLFRVITLIAHWLSSVKQVSLSYTKLRAWETGLYTESLFGITVRYYVTVCCMTLIWRSDKLFSLLSWHLHNTLSWYNTMVYINHTCYIE